MQRNLSEEWRPVAGFDGSYEVSDLGRVRSVPHETARGTRGGKIKNLRSDSDGYLIVDLHNGYKTKTCKVHSLVLEAFVGPKGEGMQACHFPDPDKANNALNNLRWDTASANSYDSVKTGTHPRLKFSDAEVKRIVDLRGLGMTHRKIAEEIGCSKPYVEKILYKKLRQVPISS